MPSFFFLLKNKFGFRNVRTQGKIFPGPFPPRMTVFLLSEPIRPLKLINTIRKRGKTFVWCIVKCTKDRRSGGEHLLVLRHGTFNTLEKKSHGKNLL